MKAKTHRGMAYAVLNIGENRWQWTITPPAVCPRVEGAAPGDGRLDE